MKRLSILASSIILSTPISASDYNAFINKAMNDYEVESSINTEYTDWVEVSTYDCSSSPQLSDIYNGTEFEQTESCSVDYTRTKNVYSYDEDDNKTLESSTVQYKTELEEDQITQIGTYLATSCYDVLNHSGSIGNGNYDITIDSTNYSMYCDMDNGGLTLVMHLKDSSQLSGSLSDVFWSTGANLSTSYVTSTFSQLNLSDQGFIGWSNLLKIKNTETSSLDLKITGTNSIGNVVNEDYELLDFNPDMTDSIIDTGSLSGGGIYTISKMSDIGIRGGWGTCGVNSYDETNSYQHVGFGLCPEGYNANEPYGREVQVWHYDEYQRYVNVSFDSDSNTDSNHTFNGGFTFDIYMYIK